MPSKLERVLYVEDDPVIYPLTIMALEDFGACAVAHCASGREALEKAEGFAPEILLLDVMMPGMDGIETLARLRRIASLSTIPAVFMTAKARTLEPQVFHESGAAAVISKPFDPLTLSDQLNAIWNEARNCTAPSSSAREPARSAPADAKEVPGFRLELDDLQDAYRERRNRVLEKVRHVEGGHDFTKAEFADFLHELHQLAGSAGFFAQAALGRAAAHLEEDLAGTSMAQACLVLRARGDDLRRSAHVQPPHR